MSPKSEPTNDAAGGAESWPRAYRFEIFRYSADKPEPPRLQTYEVTLDTNMSVLEAVLRIQDEQDPSLAFRYACRGAVCGSCAMSINGQLNLACRVQLDTLPTNHIVLEPLPGFDVIKDLVIDMEPFWEKYRLVQPWLQREMEGARDGRMSEAERKRIDQFTNCILCGLCYGACPVARLNPSFTGPAALSKLYRFLADVRDQRDGQWTQAVDDVDGLWGCHTVMRCADVCPKEVRPSEGIRGARRKCFSQNIKSLFRSPSPSGRGPG